MQAGFTCSMANACHYTLTSSHSLLRTAGRIATCIRITTRSPVGDVTTTHAHVRELITMAGGSACCCHALALAGQDQRAHCTCPVHAMPANWGNTRGENAHAVSMQDLHILATASSMSRPSPQSHYDTVHDCTHNRVQQLPTSQASLQPSRWPITVLYMY